MFVNASNQLLHSFGPIALAGHASVFGTYANAIGFRLFANRFV